MATITDVSIPSIRLLFGVPNRGPNLSTLPTTDNSSLVNELLSVTKAPAGSEGSNTNKLGLSATVLDLLQGKDTAGSNSFTSLLFTEDDNTTDSFANLLFTRNASINITSAIANRVNTSVAAAYQPPSSNANSNISLAA